MIFPARDFKFFERFGLLFFLKMRLLYWLWCLFVRRYFQSETWWPKGSIYFYNKPLPSLCPSLTSSFLTGPSHLQHVSHHVFCFARLTRERVWLPKPPRRPPASFPPLGKPSWGNFFPYPRDVTSSKYATCHIYWFSGLATFVFYQELNCINGMELRKMPTLLYQYIHIIQLYKVLLEKSLLGKEWMKKWSLNFLPRIKSERSR